MANTAALACYGASYLARRRRSRAKGLALSLVGAALVTGGGYLGGHLAYVRGVNVNRNAWDHALEEWTSVADEADLRHGEPVVAQAGETTVLLLRHEVVVSSAAFIVLILSLEQSELGRPVNSAAATKRPFGRGLVTNGFTSTGPRRARTPWRRVPAGSGATTRPGRPP